MKNLKNAVLSVIGCVLLLALVCLDTNAQTKSKPMPMQSAKIVNCKTNNSDCFIRAANTCQKATLKMNKPLMNLFPNPDVPAPTYTQSYRFEIRGVENDKCTFYTKVEKSDVKYSEDFILFAIKDRGKSRQEVEQELAGERKEYQQTAGRDGVCSFRTEKLVDMLSGWWQKDGGYRYSSQDFKDGNCQGTLYNSTLPTKTIKLSEMFPQ
jgi:hypothetical protein